MPWSAACSATTSSSQSPRLMPARRAASSAISRVSRPTPLTLQAAALFISSTVADVASIVAPSALQGDIRCFGAYGEQTIKAAPKWVNSPPPRPELFTKVVARIDCTSMKNPLTKGHAPKQVRRRLQTKGFLEGWVMTATATLGGGSYFTTRQALDFACISPRNGPDCSHVKYQNALDFTEIMRYHAAMYVETVPNRGSPPAILLRESYREGKSVRKRTLLNLSNWSAEHIEGLRGVLKGGIVVPAGREAFAVQRSLPHGHVAAALGMARAIGLDRLLGPKNKREPNRPRDLVLAMIVSRIIAPASKLATAKALDPATAASSLGVELGLGEVGESELYAALDWLHERQGAVEAALAKRHLKGGTLVLYDVSSSYVEGRCCPLAKRGYNRDGKKGKAQIVYGLL